MMATITQLDTRLITRHDTEENWIANDPTLMAGEIAISDPDSDHTLPRFKVGVDNIKTWSEIPYCLDTSDLLNKINNIKPTTENTYFTEDMTVTYPFGKYTPDETGSVKVPTKDKSVYDALLDAFAEAKDPDVDYPSVSIAVSGGSGEVGTTFTLPTATLTVDDVGSYTYGSKDASDNKYDSEDTGVVFGSNNVTLSCGSKSVSNSSTMIKGSTLQLQAEGSDSTYGDTSISFTFDATANYLESDRVPVNNLGSKVPAKQITSGSTTVSSKTATFSGYRKCFWGYRLVADALSNPATITSAQVRDTSIIQKSGTSLPTSYEVPAGTKQVFFLAKKGTKTSLSITDGNALNAPVACEKVAGGGTASAPTGVWVEGANSYAATAYDLWYVNLDGSFGKAGKLNLTWK